MCHPVRTAVAGLPTVARITAVALAMLASACMGSRNVSVEPLGPRYARTIWESIEVIPTAEAVQRSFVPLALLHGPESARFLDEGTLTRLQRAASEFGANAIVLEAVRSTEVSDPTRVDPPTSEGWSGVATAIRVVDARWGDRYWRYAPAPGELDAAPGDPGAGEVEPPTPFAAAEAADEEGPGWRRLLQWEGSGDDQTERFDVSTEEWRVVWQASDATGTLEILVYGSSEEDLRARIDQAGMATGAYLGLAGEGSYYLKINGEGVNWTIAVDAWTPP